ncbi:MAG: DUF1553 domain-containing protein [Gemmataceae bacterium]
MKTLLPTWFLVISALSAPAAELKLLPAEVTLHGPRATQRLIVVREQQGRVVGAQTERVQFVSSDPKVATVDDSGTVRATGEGTALITATLDSQKATAKVTARPAQAEFVPSFRNDLIPILTKAGCNSGACHGALAGKGGLKLSLRGYDPETDHFVLTRQALGRRIDRRQPARSLLLLKPTLVLEHGGGQKLDIGSTDYQWIAEWIAQGAPGPRDEDASIQRLEVLPGGAVLQPGDQLPLVVLARYSDGTTRDVTAWAKFESTEENVAHVDDDGLVTVAGHGEAAITVWYSNLVAINQVAAPLPNAIEPRVFAHAERHNYIDDLVLQKLRSLNMPPSPRCTDHEFIRRAYLDGAGILPTPEEVTRFVGDPSPDKRARLIEALLERPEYVDYWTYKWSDLLLVSTRKLPQPAMWSFHHFVRRSVADNKPWDQFARELLTANGSNLHNGAANYFVLHKDTAELAETTAVTFLGMSITCARCHNHPLEKWTQDQYWSMANLFARVALKNGDRQGEVTVQTQPSGDVPHPRRAVPLPPAPLDAEPLPLDSRADRRQYFADWLTAKDNPYFAPAFVNRVWRNFLGRGLVEAEDDLRQTNPPTNPPLLDALAQDFIAHRYDVKHLIRVIMNSATYQRSSVPVPGNETDDRFYARYLIRRLPAEVVLDAYAQVTNVPTPFTQVRVGTSGGVANNNSYPLGTRALQLPDTQLVSRFLDSFGRPERSRTCACERQEDATVGQALHLNNGQTLNDKLRDKHCRVEQWVQEHIDDETAIRRVFLLSLSRAPTATEVKNFQTLLADAAADPDTTRRQALEDLFWAVLTGKEFLFNH